MSISSVYTAAKSLREVPDSLVKEVSMSISVKLQGKQVYLSLCSLALQRISLLLTDKCRNHQPYLV